MAKKTQIKKNTEVIVIAGAHKGASGKVLSISKKTQRAQIDKVNIIKKHVKPSQTNPDGGVQEVEGTIHLSNLKIKPKSKTSAFKKSTKEHKPAEGKVANNKTVKPSREKPVPNNEKLPRDKPSKTSPIASKAKEANKNQAPATKQKGDKE